jgi:hypothetical protein
MHRHGYNEEKDVRSLGKSFEGQRRAGNFGAIRSASLLRKSILDNDQQATTAAGLAPSIQIVCQCSIYKKMYFINILYAVRRNIRSYSVAPSKGMSLKNDLKFALPNV